MIEFRPTGMPRSCRHAPDFRENPPRRLGRCGPRHLAQAGFTLLEMLAVIVLLGIVAVIVARSVGGSVNSGKWKAGKIGVTKLDQDVQLYMLDNGSPPARLDDLMREPGELPTWHGPYAKPSDLKDPFGHPYRYIKPGKHGAYDIVFLGRDGEPGGKGMDRDYGNWQ